MSQLKQLATSFRVVSVIGPRQAGKTTLCQMAFQNYRYVSLEEPDIRQYATQDPRGFLSDYNKYVIFDEIQRVPQLLSYIQTIVDKDQLKGQFILTGSHHLELRQALSQSLAGRSALLTLLPLTIQELTSITQESDLDSVILNGLMPGMHHQEIPKKDFFRAYFQTYIERDVRQLIQLKDFTKFEKFIRLCAGRIGQLLNHASLANEVGVSAVTINGWLSVLEASFIIYRLPPYFENFGKRLIKSSKLYFIDTGLAAWLLGIDESYQLKRDPLRGALFENLIIIESLKHLQNQGKDARLFFFRDSIGNEVDLIFQYSRQLLPIEIKSSKTWHSSFLKGIKYFTKLTADRSLKGIVIYSGSERRNNSNYQLLNYFDLQQIFYQTR
ncbi:MAG: ATP-binding protein [Enterobacterales bacterium]|nr:ATP-binding protein [Enterobacterales bacterium]